LVSFRVLISVSKKSLPKGNVSVWALDKDLLLSSSFVYSQFC